MKPQSQLSTLIIDSMYQILAWLIIAIEQKALISQVQVWWVEEWDF